MRDHFSGFHPAVQFFYFAIVLLFAMVFMHPILQAISLAGAAAYSILLRGRKAIAFQLLYMVPFFLIAAVINPAFNHAGVTILFYLDNGNPITLESILYGLATSCMLVTVILWFSCYNAVMTSDKFIYLFGKIIPSLSLIFSMALRFVPRYKAQLKAISQAQKCVGRDVSQGSLLARARNGLTILSIMTTWALENAIETADSMKARGYGLPGRTSFSLYRLDGRDRITLTIMAALLLIVATGAIRGETAMRYFPSIQAAEGTMFGAALYAVYGMLCFWPIIIHVLEEIKWRFTQSKI
ncbi:energy-coupling factor transporter transmembrane component T [Paenibacillus sp. GCM10027627]|uniref:energy-coupling factor transporter transmembrane component T n=1 Tax=unclassified Paenibacillus TaxID=185978 RepID=UPI00362B2E7B